MRLRSIWHFNRLTFFLVDYILLWGAVVCAFKLSPRYLNDILIGPLLNRELWFVGYGMPLFMAMGLQVTGLQQNQAGFRPSEAIARTIAGLIGGMLAFVVLHAVLEFSLIGRFVLIFSLGYGTAFIVGSRMLVGKLAEHQKRNVLFYGTEATYRIITQQVESCRLPIRLVGHARLESLLPGDTAPFVETKRLELYSHCQKLGATEIVVEVPDALTLHERDALLFCTELGVNVVELGYFFERDLERVFVPGLKESWFWGYAPTYVHPVYFAAKRILDIAVSLAGLVCFLPLAPVVVLLVKLQDRGPVMYTQVRVGLRNQPFRIYKFRTMRTDAETGGAQWAQKADPRVTRIGRFLRQTRLDEVPQFWNILRGEMSFIGPRPERPEFVEAIEKEVPFYRYRHLIKPGLTGWAQINYPYGASVEDAGQKLSYDLYYMKYCTLTRELHIMLRTVVAMIKGAR
jgi:exopolysaccharide biosynthesis polyprenyl glycosylphosphotransferase